MPKQYLACVNLSLAMVLVGSSVVAGKIMVEELPVHLASALRFALALAILAPLVLVREGGLPRLSRRTWLKLATQSLCGSFLFTVFLLHGLTLTGPASAGVITSTTPACMGLIAWVFLKDRPHRRAVLGILLSVAGVLVLNLAGTDGPGGANPVFGNLLVLAAVVFESLFLLIRKTVPEPLSPLAASTVISGFGLLWFLPGGVVEAASTDLSAISATGWLVVGYYGAFVTVLAYLFWFAGITRVAPSTAGVFTAVMPVSALILSALVLNEPIGWQQLAGCGCVLGSIVLISR
ncbi:DMT family transporter [Pseudodesulfovibrio indicus]|uniref:Drug/metabolite transporter (DMT)-like permease n=1 Tax=Pseudodesulfovibrio indicus TaxID=1716143 RepID=A0A140D998_9BACT|nr:DMT family transporter [Pseudodesulfovibrio indicus]AMK09765.1 multidrug transporter [Pseudodesulfovibrio indicus]TDT86274.1 drug/metabolite transporter (DMT)-like permease [Pseudodesulfovibrio indicus]